jgi:hypothetical protein
MFRIYYADGSTFDGDPFEAPGLGVLLIVERDIEHGRRIVSGGDYFVWRDSRWFSADQIGMLDYLLQPGPRKVIVGRMVDNETYRNVYIAADSDPEFPTRTAYHVFERKP